jgi:hypothetical protein
MPIGIGIETSDHHRSMGSESDEEYGYRYRNRETSRGHGCLRITMTKPAKKIDKLESENVGLRELRSDNASLELSFANEISGNSTIANANKRLRHSTPFA